jgi:16S rRNA (guanine527-N7)-methyltransferase
MEFQEFNELFCSSCHLNGIPTPTPQQIQTFWQFTLHLMEVNQHTNLTAIRSIPDAIPKHYVDSLFAAEYLPQGARVLDLGCGPGFPSIPLAIYRPDLSIVALDSTDKKVRFVKECAELLPLPNLQAVTGRAEDGKIRKELGQFDVVVSRAVARMNVLSELCLPYVKKNGTFLAMKAAKWQEELEEAQKAILLLGGSTPDVHHKELILNDGPEQRSLIQTQKVASTPPQYPRTYAAILKKPLGSS